MFGPGWYRNPLVFGPSAAPDAPVYAPTGNQSNVSQSFAHAAGVAGDSYRIPCVFVDTFQRQGGLSSGSGDSSVPVGDALWTCQRYGVPYDSSARPSGPPPPAPLQTPYPRYVYDHPVTFVSDITAHYEYAVGPATGNPTYTGSGGAGYFADYGQSGACTVTISGLSADGDYSFLFGHALNITYPNPYYGLHGYPDAPETITVPGFRYIFPDVPGEDILASLPSDPVGSFLLGPVQANLSFVYIDYGTYAGALAPNAFVGATSYLTTGFLESPTNALFSYRPLGVIRILVGTIFSAAFTYAPPGVYPSTYYEEMSDDAPLTLVTATTQAKTAAWIRLGFQPDIAPALGLAAANAVFETDIAHGAAPISSPYLPYPFDPVSTPTHPGWASAGNASPVLVGLLPGSRSQTAAQINTEFSSGSVQPYHLGLGYLRDVTSLHYDFLTYRLLAFSQRTNSGDVGGSSGVLRLDHLAPVSHDADIAVTLYAGPLGLSPRRWIWNEKVHITGHLSDHGGGTGTTGPTTDTDLSDLAALDQDPATGRLYLAKAVSGKIQIAAREGWQSLAGTPARDYAPLLGPDGTPVAGKSPHLASRTAGGDAARGGLTTLVYQDAGGHVVLAMSDDGLHSVGAPTMPIFTETGGLPCHLHDESTGLTYVAASFSVAPAATAPAGTVSTTEDLRLVRLGANNVAIPWADGKLEKVIKLGAPKAGRPSLTQNRMDPEQALLLIHGDKKYAGTMGGELWQEITT